MYIVCMLYPFLPCCDCRWTPWQSTVTALPWNRLLHSHVMVEVEREDIQSVLLLSNVGGKLKLLLLLRIELCGVWLGRKHQHKHLQLAWYVKGGSTWLIFTWPFTSSMLTVLYRHRKKFAVCSFVSPDDLHLKQVSEQRLGFIWHVWLSSPESEASCVAKLVY